jgi:DNA polymerase-3 subunit epsilon
MAEIESTPWQDLEFVGFDTETTGKYPLAAEVCELAAVKWRGGEVIATYSTLLKPSQPMGAEVIGIHGITNEMVENAPRMSEKIVSFWEFIQGSVLIAHHAPFDLGFVSLAFEEANLALPILPVICSSLLSRKLFPQSANHRLQTLIGFFKLQQGQAHRAEDDARACLEVALKCFEKLGSDAPLSLALEAQGGALIWQRFSMQELLKTTPLVKTLIEAIRSAKIVELAYGAGSKPGEKRRLHPLGLVRSLDGDFLVAYDERDQRQKRYLIEKVLSVASL